MKLSDWLGFEKSKSVHLWSEMITEPDCRCQAKFLTCEISDFTPCPHAQSDILHIKYAETTEE